MKNYFILHGSFGSPYSNWLPWLFTEIEKTKPNLKEEPVCYAPQFPTGVGFQNYEKCFKNLCKCGFDKRRNNNFCSQHCTSFCVQIFDRKQYQSEKTCFCVWF